MAANVDAMVLGGQNAFKAGNKEEARALLMKAAELDPYNEQAWLWLSAVVDGVDDQRTCLENVLAINPQNERARNGLQVLIQQSEAAQAPQAPETPQDSSTSTSVEWDVGGIPTSSASARPAQPELSDQDYDNWLANLNLPQSTGAPAPASAQNFASSPFGDVNVFDDELFTASPFS